MEVATQLPCGTWRKGTGVKPDIETKAVDALGRAHLAAVKALLVRGQEPKKQAALERVREDLEARK